MKRRNEISSRVTEYVIKLGLTAALVAAVLAPTTIRVQGAENPASPTALRIPTSEALPLPPLPHLETMHWLTFKPRPQTLKIDTLLGPKFELLGPAVADENLSSGAPERAG
jgi:hypothetical protein